MKRRFLSTAVFIDGIRHGGGANEVGKKLKFTGKLFVSTRTKKEHDYI